MAQTAVDNEKYFSDLDAVVGDGDFGYSLARGFEIVLADWDDLDRTDAATFLKKVAIIITSRIGGTSGPIWGTAFLRAGVAVERRRARSAPTRPSPCSGRPSRASSSAASPTSATRPCWTRSCPATDTLEERLRAGDEAGRRLPRRPRRPASRRTPPRPCSPSAGAPPTPASAASGARTPEPSGVAVMFEQLAKAWPRDVALAGHMQQLTTRGKVTP